MKKQNLLEKLMFHCAGGHGTTQYATEAFEHPISDEELELLATTFDVGIDDLKKMYNEKCDYVEEQAPATPIMG